MPDTLPRRVVLKSTAAAMLGIAATSSFALAAGEGGESGEGAAVEALDGPLRTLTTLALFDASNRIVAELVALGAPDAALEHLESSHHASYEDIEAGLDALGQPGFAQESDAFAAAIRNGAGADAIAAAWDSLSARIEAAYAAATPAQMMKVAETLTRISYQDFMAGVIDGEVYSPQEYRDAWGFATVATDRLAALSQSDDPGVADAAAAGLAAMEPVAALFPDLTADSTEGDPSVLAGAAARIEIAGLRLE